jgi:hypothetical protein
MIISRRTRLILFAPIAGTLVGLAACGKTAEKAGSPQQDQAASPPTASPVAADKALAAQVQAPPLPDSSRTDPEAVAMRKKYVQWNVARVKAANDAAVKQANQALGIDKPAPKEN